MNIAIDARWIFPQISGIGAYTRELIAHLAREDVTNRYLLIFDNVKVLERAVHETGLDQVPNFERILVSYSPFSLQSQIRLPRLFAAHNVRVFHSPNFMIPLLAFPVRRPHRTKCVTTVHDVIPLLFPNAAPRSKKARLFPIYRRLMIEIGRRSDVIITVSLASARDVTSQLRLQAGSQKVRTVYCGVNPRFQPAATPKRLTNTSVREILYVGRADPYKNLATLIRAFDRARRRLPFPVRLVVAGSPDSRYREAPELAERLELGQSVRWTGYLGDQELLDCYQQADLLVQPSRYEGFGLQVLEAMACGVPVICANAGSLPEVAGDAALMLDCDDVDGFTDRIVDVLTNADLVSEMCRKGMSQAANFSWSRTARQTLRLYAELGGA